MTVVLNYKQNTLQYKSELYCFGHTEGNIKTPRP